MTFAHLLSYVTACRHAKVPFSGLNVNFLLACVFRDMFLELLKLNCRVEVNCVLKQQQVMDRTKRTRSQTKQQQSAKQLQLKCHPFVVRFYKSDRHISIVRVH